MTTKKLNFKKMSLADLQNCHSDMIKTAEDLGYASPDSVLQLFDTEEAGAAICAEFHEGLTNFRAGLDEAQMRVADEPKEEQAEAKPLPDTAKGRKIAKAKAKAEADTKKPKHPAPAEKEESTVAVATKSAKKAPAKKAAKKAAPAKKTASAREPRSAFNPEDKITWIYKGEGIGCREGTGKFDRHMAVKKADGKTVKTFLANKGNSQSLAACVAEKKAKVG